ncbi:Two-component regulator, signal transduction response regulator, receiver domain (CheY-like) [Alteracholeplasma palmae J233]|uniref:Two-component regulator, signal transduction response regulator, receiver domain (CheY-like) n=1 Tax=Alteracholeplasma palmae (strain ATCC 49389 / J233) TaxID=1318466 RepID=U4KLG6_ALTPJ|nr:response regulator transcription factor [Alteracholeplasma palmae]CCV64682.1 Two-component regulator, signal transduction response regulator, receiver domain (CheY-like) [Alteracholeplasma palmae J233]
MNILLIEDEKKLALALVEALSKHNYIVDMAFNGKAGLEEALSIQYDLIILDMMLPELDGIDVLKSLRENNNNTPVLVLTAKSTVSDKVIGLNAGADDYLTKPFSFQELLARIKVLLRRPQTIVSNIYDFNGLSLNSDTCILSYQNESVLLPAKEFHLMSLFFKNIDTYLSKDEILNRIWGYDTEVGYNTIEVYISFLRKKMSALNAPITIKAFRNIGYKLELTNV